MAVYRNPVVVRPRSDISSDSLPQVPGVRLELHSRGAWQALACWTLGKARSRNAFHFERVGGGHMLVLATLAREVGYGVLDALVPTAGISKRSCAARRSDSARAWPPLLLCFCCHGDIQCTQVDFAANSCPEANALRTIHRFGTQGPRLWARLHAL